MSHFYETAPAHAFWSRAVARDWRAADTFASPAPIIGRGEKVASAGSCFAAAMVPHLVDAGIDYVRTETVHPAFAHLPGEDFGYAHYSAAYGNVYSPRQMLQLVRRARGSFAPAEDRWAGVESVIDPFRPGLRYRARSEHEFDRLRAQHFACVRRALEQADVFVFTLGVTEIWESAIDGAVFPASPGTVAGTFDPARHLFRNLTVAELVADLTALIAELESINPRLRLVLTVSPVPLVATASGEHVLTANTYSKSALRVAAGEIAAGHPHVTYFPSYEIVTGPQAPEDFFEADRRRVSPAGTRAVMDAFFANCEIDPARRPAAPTDVAGMVESSSLSEVLSDAECEELMADRRIAPPDLKAGV